MSDDKQSKKLVAKLPDEDDKRPMVLVWADKASLEADGPTVFSEVVDGLTGEAVAEKAETTGGPSEAADTTIDF